MAEGVKFNLKEQTEFITELRVLVNAYFKDNNLSRFANGQMIFKTVFMLALYLIPLVLMTTGLVSTFWPVFGMWVIMGFGMSGIGLAVMHDANHAAYSSKKSVNKAVGALVNIIGGNHTNWIIQHNVLHHSFTNIDGFDEDIEKGVMRFSPNQKRKWLFKFQVFYAPIFYGILTIYWFIAKDFEQLYKFSKRKLIENQGLSFSKSLFQILLGKVVYIALIIVLPLLTVDLPFGELLIGFLTMHFVSGILLALVFQSAHVLEETEFFVPDENGSVDNNWAIHQLKTTSNFAGESDVLTWLVGGLNYQIEHHLFPNICHVHYKPISKMVKSMAKKHHVPYKEHKTFGNALMSHFRLLNDLGTGAYDARVSKA